MEPKMTGWKTKAGAAMGAAAGVLLGLIPVLPPALVAYVVWIKFASAVLGSSGAALLGLGIGHKVEKAGNGAKVIALLLLLPTLFLFSGCAALQPTPEGPPPGCEDSLIYQYIPSPKVADIGFKVALYEVAKRKPEYKPVILDALNKFEQMLSEGAYTYSGFVEIVISRVKWLNKHAGVELLIVTESLGVFENIDLPMADCDRRLLTNHIQEQKRYISLIVE
jgi:hypothetical protein